MLNAHDTRPSASPHWVQFAVNPRDRDRGNEAHFSTQQSQATEDARLPSAHANHRRPERPEAPPSPRPASPSRLTHGPTKARFEQIYKEGKRVSGGSCRIIALPGEGLVGFATSRSIGSKPRRNRLKRRFRDALRSQQEIIDSRLDYILMLLPSAEQTTYAAIREEVATLINRVNARWASEWVSS